LVPGIGTTSSPFAITHASASCAAVTPRRCAIACTRSTSRRLRSNASPEKRGKRCARESELPKIGRVRDRAGQETAAQRAVRDESDSELAHGRQNVALDVALPQRELRLKRGDRVDRVRAPNRAGEASDKPR